MPQIHRVASEYSVPVYSASGLHVVSGARHIARRALREDRPTLLLHVGDYDPSGVATFDHIPKDGAVFVAEDRPAGHEEHPSCQHLSMPIISGWHLTQSGHDPQTHPHPDTDRAG